MLCCIPNCSNSYRQSVDRSITYHNFPHPTKEASRFKSWLHAINSPKVFQKSSTSVYQQLHVCRKHFEKQHFNGICKRLQKTAIPTLFLDGDTNVKKKNVNEPNNTTRQEAVTESANIDDEMMDGAGEQTYYTYYEVVDSPTDEMQEVDDAMEENFIDEERLEFDLPDCHDESLKQEEPEIILAGNVHAAGDRLLVTHNNVLQPKFNSITREEVPTKMFTFNANRIEVKKEYEDEDELIENGDNLIEEWAEDNGADDVDEPNEMYDVIDVVEDYNKIPLSEENFKQWRKDFYSDQKNILAQNICSRVDPFEVCLSRKAIEKTHHVFNYKIENECKPLTNQKSSGRCWIFAALNVIRVPFAKEMKLEEFEFSQSYLFYWDKIERCHYFLNNIVETSQRGEEVDGRLISFLLNDPTCDGGQWDMICNLINKYGLMPKKCFPETYSCESSHNMNAILKSKLREYARILHEMVQASKDDDEIKKTIQKQMTEVYNVVGICLGIPPETFTWEYYAEKSKEYKRVGPLSANEFYEKLVKPVFDVNNKVCLVTDPRPTSSYGKAYTVDCLGNVVGGRPVLYNNQPVEVLMDLVKTSLQKGEPVWFGCEVSKRFAGKLGVEDLEIHDFKVVFNVDIQITMSKADRLRYGESAMTHAMAFTAAAVDENDKATKFRVENSWGEDRGEKGYLIMSADWFKEFVFEIVVDKNLVPAEIMKVFEMTPIVLPAWDPMGTLAKDSLE